MISKSATPQRIVSNLEAAELVLSEGEVAKIDTLDRPDGRIGGEPVECTF